MVDKRVLIFEDDKDLLIIFEFLFEDNGWQVFTNATSDEVIERTEEVQPHLILMDNWIPNIGGIAATQALKADSRFSRIPVIYISANNDVSSLSEKAGADAFMAKPFDFDELCGLADKLLNKLS